MAKVTPQLIRELRERTQAGMTDCKNALVEAEGDADKAVEIILKKGLAKAAKRQGAVAAEGEIRSHISNDARSGVLLEVNIQTDFAARNDKFKAFVEDVLKLATGVHSLDELLKCTMPNSSKSVDETRVDLTATIGEKVDVRRFARVDASAPVACVHSYVHMNGRIGVLLEASAETPEVLKHETSLKFIDDYAMQIAAMAPYYLERSQVPESEVSKQREIYEAQVKEENKPEKAWPKIIEGKINKWYTDICLLEQVSVIEPTKSVEQIRAEASKEAGGNIKLLSFVRFQLGEGLTAKGGDFAEEAKKMAGDA